MVCREWPPEVSPGACRSLHHWGIDFRLIIIETKFQYGPSSFAFTFSDYSAYLHWSINLTISTQHAHQIFLFCPIISSFCIPVWWFISPSPKKIPLEGCIIGTYQENPMKSSPKSPPKSVSIHLIYIDMGNNYHLRINFRTRNHWLTISTSVNPRIL